MTTSSSAAFGSDLRSALIAMVRKRVPESEVEDIVQAAMAEAVESPNAPKDPESLRKWIFGVAKHKVVDYHRRAGRLSFELPDVPGKPAPHVEADLLRWAEKNLPDGEEAQKTLDWMIREGEGEKLESIAESEHLPAPRVRQRVSRLRRHLKANWQREVALLAAFGVLVSVAVMLYLRSKKPEPIATDPRTTPLEPRDPRAQEIRKAALEKCGQALFKDCIEGLDEAKRLDPAGDTRPDVQRAREDAAKSLQQNPPPPPTPSAEPTSLAPVPTEVPTAEIEKEALKKALDKSVTKGDSMSSPAPTPTPTTTPTPAPSSFPAPQPKAAKPGPKSAGSKKMGGNPPGDPSWGGSSF